MGVCGSKPKPKDDGIKKPIVPVKVPEEGGATKIDEIKVQENRQIKPGEGSAANQKSGTGAEVSGDKKAELEKPTATQGKPDDSKAHANTSKPSISIGDGAQKDVTSPAINGAQTKDLASAGQTGQDPLKKSSLGSPGDSQQKVSPAVDQNLAKQKTEALEEIRKAGTDENVKTTCPKDTPIIVTENVRLNY